MSLTRSLTQPITRPLAAAVTAGVGGVPLLAVPSGFDWTPPVNVYGSGTTFATNYAAANYIPATTAELWVSTTGNDTTGTGTQGAPYRSFNKALIEAAALPDAGVHVRVMAGFYNAGVYWNNNTPDKKLVVTSEGGQAICSSANNVTWTLQGSGAYKGPRTSVSKVYDTTNLDAYGNPTLMTKVADEAACAALPNSFATDGVSVWVNTFDGRVPTNASVRVLLAGLNGKYTVNKQWYIRGVTFEGGGANAPFFLQAAASHTETVTFEDCEFRFSEHNGLRHVGAALCVVVNCKAYGNDQDGFNYQASATVLSPKVVEIGCLGYGNGLADNNDNGSSMHGDGRVLRVNCTHAANLGYNVPEATTSCSWNLGCQALDSASADVGGLSDCGFFVETGKMWLDGCTATGSAYSVQTATGGQIRHRNCTLSGLTTGDVATY